MVPYGEADRTAIVTSELCASWALCCLGGHPAVASAWSQRLVRLLGRTRASSWDSEPSAPPSTRTWAHRLFSIRRSPPHPVPGSPRGPRVPVFLPASVYAAWTGWEPPMASAPAGWSWHQAAPTQPWQTRRDTPPASLAGKHSLCVLEDKGRKKTLIRSRNSFQINPTEPAGKSGLKWGPAFRVGVSGEECTVGGRRMAGGQGSDAAPSAARKPQIGGTKSSR